MGANGFLTATIYRRILGSLREATKGLERKGNNFCVKKEIYTELPYMIAERAFLNVLRSAVKKISTLL